MAKGEAHPGSMTRVKVNPTITRHLSSLLAAFEALG